MFDLRCVAGTMVLIDCPWVCGNVLAKMNSRSRSLCRRPSVCRLSVTFVHPTQAIEIFGNVSTPFGKMASC